MKYLLPWKLKHNPIRFKLDHENTSFWEGAIGYVYDAADGLYYHRILTKEGHRIPNFCVGHSSKEEAMECVDRILLEVGWEFIMEERAEKLRLLL